MPVTSRRPLTEALKDARVYLSSVNNNQVQPSEEDASARQALDCCCRLLEAILFNSQEEDGKSSITLNSADWTMVKAVLELVVRWGIYPCLSPGVGIPLEKRFGAKGARTAAAAVSEYIPGIELDRQAPAIVVPGASKQASAIVDSTNLFQAAELLAYLVLESAPTSCEPCVSIPGAATTINSPAITIDSNQAPQSLDRHPSTKETWEEELKGKRRRRFQEAALQDLMMFYHLPDLCAAYLQLAHSGRDDWRKLASQRMDSMVECLPVAHMVEALLTLLGQDSSSPAAPPPPWFKSEAGKLLSRLIMREGGVAAAIGRLVGGTQGGNVRVYERVASHLAKPPKYVATTPEYYKAVCPQLLPLLLLPFSQQEKNPEEVGSAAQILRVNMHHTAVIMACKMTAHERALSEEYLLRPLLEPLLIWGVGVCAKLEQCSSSKKVGTLQAATEMQEEESHDDVSVVSNDLLLLPRDQTLSGGESPGIDDISQQRETLVLNSLFGIQVLLTAGHEGAAVLRQLLLQLIQPIAACVLMLKILLEPPDTLHHQGGGITDDDVQASSVFQRLNVANNATPVEEGARGETDMEGSTGHLLKGKKPAKLAKGFLQKNARLYTSNEEGVVATEEPTEDVVGRLRSAASDIVLALNVLPGDDDPHSSPTAASSLLAGIDGITMNWPRADGEVKEALEAGSRWQTNYTKL